MASSGTTAATGPGPGTDDVALDVIAEHVGAGAALHAAWRAGVLDQLAAGPVAAGTVARQAGLDARLTDAVLAVLVALGIARVDAEGRYDVPATTPAAVAWAVRIYGELDRVWHDPAAGPGYDDPAGAAAAYPDLVRMLPSRADGLANEVAGHLARPGERVLDVGAGAAPWSLAIAAKAPTCRVTAMDLPGVIDVTRQAVADAGCADRFDFVAGDAFAGLPEGPFDLVVAGGLCHLFDDATAAGLIERLAGVLAPGGRVAIVDGIADDTHADAAGQAIYQLGLAVRTRGGGLHPLAAQRRWLAAAGLGELASHRVGAAGGASAGLYVIAGRRPG